MPQPGTNDFKDEDSKNSQTHIQIDDNTDDDLVFVSLPTSAATVVGASMTSGQPSSNIKPAQSTVPTESEAMEVKQSSSSSNADKGLRNRTPGTPQFNPINIIQAGPAKAATFGWSQCLGTLFSSCRKRGGVNTVSSQEPPKSGLASSSTNTQLTR